MNCHRFTPPALVALLAGAALLAACETDTVTVEEPPDTGEPVAEEPSSGGGAEDENSPADYEVEAAIVVDGLNRPWSLAFLPGDGDFALVTERPGHLNLVDLSSGDSSRVAGLPEIAAPGRAGLLDVALHPDFEENRRVYLTYVTSGEGAYALAVGRGRLNSGADALTDFEELFVATPYDRGNHYGGRMVFDGDGYLYVTSGDRQAPHHLQENHPSQDLQSYHGKTIRLNDDGSIPGDNPFVGDADALDAIYTYGHRNHQGMAVHPVTGRIWQNEHGEQDGDEINVLDITGGAAAGANYGWPIATYGRDYRDGSEIGVLPPEDPNTVDPVHWWEEGADGGFPPSGMAFYRGDPFAGWEGDMLMGNLADRYLARFEMDGETIVAEHRLLEGRGRRIRDVRVHPESGYIYVLVDANSAPLVRLTPAQ